MSEPTDHEFGVDHDVDSSSADFLIENNKKLAAQFSHLVPEGKSGTIYVSDSEFTEVLHIYLLTQDMVKFVAQNPIKTRNYPDPPFPCIIVSHSQGLIEEDDTMLRNTMSRRHLPQYFLGKDGQPYMSENYFCLAADTGRALKIECVFPLSDEKIEGWGNEGDEGIKQFKDSLPKMPDYESVYTKYQTELDPSDYEKLGKLLERVQSGELKETVKFKKD